MQREAEFVDLERAARLALVAVVAAAVTAGAVIGVGQALIDGRADAASPVPSPDGAAGFTSGG